MIIRRNNGYSESGKVPGYEHQVGIAVPLRSPEPTGLPSPEENIKLDAICNSLQEQAASLLVAIITTSGMREFVFYTRAPEQLQLRFEELRGQITSHEIQLMIHIDKTWEIYHQLN